jgi:hypothetical protein
MANFRGVRFVTSMGTITATAVTKVKIQQDTAAGGGTMADLLASGASLTGRCPGDIIPGLMRLGLV